MCVRMLGRMAIEPRIFASSRTGRPTLRAHDVFANRKNPKEWHATGLREWNIWRSRLRKPYRVTKSSRDQK